MKGTGRYIAVLFFVAVILRQATASEDPISILLKLVSRPDNRPMVVYVDPAKDEGVDVIVDDSLQNEASVTNDGRGDVALEEKAKDQAKDLLFQFLRSSPDEDSSVEDTKQVLREALRARCRKVKKCVKTCTKTYYYIVEKEKKSCPKTCQQVFDDLDLCGESSWRSTRPPMRWL